MGYLAQILKGEVMVEDRTSCQEFTGSWAKLGQANQDRLAHSRRKCAIKNFGVERGSLRIEHPVFPFDKSGHQYTTCKQRLEHFYHEERLPLRFSEQPLTEPPGAESAIRGLDMVRRRLKGGAYSLFSLLFSICSRE